MHHVPRIRARRALRALGLAAVGIALSPTPASAQGTTGVAPSSPASGTTGAAPSASASAGAPASSATTGATTGAASGATPTAPPRAAAGYGYGDTKRRETARVARPRTGGAGPVATLPGFEMLADGGSRLFVELTKNVAVEEKKAAGAVTYVLKGAHIDKRNNANALVTVHFNTPVTRARLLPSGRDLHFVVDLRQNAVPTWKLAPAKDGSSTLQIDFAKGDFLPAGGEPLGFPTASDRAPATKDKSGGNKPSTPPAAPPASESGPKPAP